MKAILIEWSFVIRILLSICISSVGVMASPADPYEEVNGSWDRFGSVYGRILENYYDEVDQEEIMQAAIEGMLERLDSYSQFYDEESLRLLRQDTTGKFAGLGITVAIKDRYPVVIAPIEGTPAYRAGLVSGDLIVKIENRSTQDMSLDEVVDLLRGEPGSQVKIGVAHKANFTATREVVIERDIIEIKSVTLVDDIRPGIGYISMRQTRFSEKTGEEVEKALEDLKSKGVQGVILDLRGNPGGLLSQATQVADLFLPKGLPIVSVKERNGRREEVKRSQRKPVAEDLPLVVLIDGGSASASEIVAGAIQDNDRGIILGTTSFGKGSVQTIFDLHETEDTALKLTTALYYTPSGRSIHRESISGLHGLSFQLPNGEGAIPVGPALDVVLRAGSAEQASSALRARFDLDEREIQQILETPLADLTGGGLVRVEAETDSMRGAKGKTYFTKKGRTVYGGGGITPDIEVPVDRLPEYVVELKRRRLFFDYVVDYVAADTTRIQDGIDPVLLDSMTAGFRRFIGQKEIASTYTRITQRELEHIRRLAEELGLNHEVGSSIDQVEGAIERGLSRGFSPKMEPYIRKGLKRELALRISGKRAQLRVELEEDPQLEKAIEVLLDGKRYTRVLDKKTS